MIKVKCLVFLALLISSCNNEDVNNLNSSNNHSEDKIINSRLTSYLIKDFFSKDVVGIPIEKKYQVELSFFNLHNKNKMDQHFLKQVANQIRNFSVENHEELNTLIFNLKKERSNSVLLDKDSRIVDSFLDTSITVQLNITFIGHIIDEDQTIVLCENSIDIDWGSGNIYLLNNSKRDSVLGVKRQLWIK